MKEIANHLQHLSITFDRLLSLLFTEEELDYMLSAIKITPEVPFEKTSWVKTSDLVVKGVTTEKMVLLHLLWFQSVGRIRIEDVDPYYGAVRITMRLGTNTREYGAATCS